MAYTRPLVIRELDGILLETPLLVPKAQTLDYYGLSFRHWKKLARACGGLCGICRKIPASGRLVIDHEHVPGWKRLPPAKRALYVRGLLCSTCNHYILSRYATAEKLRAAAEFLERYLKRRPK